MDSKSARAEAFEEFLASSGEDDADDLITLAQTAFNAGWDAMWARATISAIRADEAKREQEERRHGDI